MVLCKRTCNNRIIGTKQVTINKPDCVNICHLYEIRVFSIKYIFKFVFFNIMYPVSLLRLDEFIDTTHIKIQDIV